jgi:tyrosyl-tRNA synthetase
MIERALGADGAWYRASALAGTGMLRRMGDGIIDELRWRGLIEQITDEDRIRARLAAGSTHVYCGFDPTAASLHVGNLVPLLGLARFQRAGHSPIALVGGGTGLIGDPKAGAERSLTADDVVEAWSERFRHQIEPFLDFRSTVAPAILVDNHEWLSRLSAIELMRDVGKHFPVGYMLAKETVRSRLAGAGISYTEFSYMLLQSYDYLLLRRRFGCHLQVGGSDQWGNITAGCELIRRVDAASADALTFPLITKADGAKFGKSEAGAIYIDPAMTSTYAFYQFWLNTDDADVVRFLRTFTFLDRETIDELAMAVAERPHERAAARRLATEFTTLVHGEHECARAGEVSEALFGGGRLAAVDPARLAVALDGIPTVRLDPAAEPPTFAQLLVDTGLAASLSEARRLVVAGGVKVNDDRLGDADARPSLGQFLGERFLLLTRGKRARGMVVREG